MGEHVLQKDISYGRTCLTGGLEGMSSGRTCLIGRYVLQEHISLGGHVLQEHMSYRNNMSVMGGHVLKICFK